MAYNHILLVDDNESIHEDIEMVLSNRRGESGNDLDQLEADLFPADSIQQTSTIKKTDYHIDHAYQGREAIEMVDRASHAGDDYSLIFMDVRMPPGIDGIQTIKRIWENHPYTEMVICTAYSDYSWDQIIENLGSTDKLLFIKKPFNTIALKQMALTLTTKWKLQQESILHTQKLEEEVEIRTKQLHDLVDKYKDMKKQAEEASAAKSIFLANMSHEIRTPMNGVIGMNDLLLETNLDEEQEYLSTMVKRSARSLLQIINDILDFTKIEAGKMEIETIPFRVDEVVKEVVEIITHSSEEKGLYIHSSVDDDIPEVLLGDSTRLRQILLNYGSNAVKFTEEGEVSIKVEHLSSDGEEHLIQFAVADTGRGISKDKQTEIFTSFSQEDSSTTRKYGGTGLGLAISRQFAELMGGEVGVKSEKGVGSTFYFIAPFKEAEIEQDSSASNVDDIQKSRPFPEQSKVLLAEDNKMNQIVTTKILENEGFVVDTVENGHEVLEAVRENNYDFVLMDIQMPDMDGYEATEQIRKEEQEGHLPIIALTASVMKEDQELCFEAGMDNFISKPFEKEELISVLKQTLGEES